MVANILIAVSFMAVGFVSGVWYAGALILSKYKKYPIDTILLIDQYAQKW